MKDQLRDAHARVKLHGNGTDIRQFERNLTLEAGIDEARGSVDHDREATDAAAPIDRGHQIVGDRDFFDRGTESELTWMKDERLTVRHMQALAGRDERLRIARIETRDLARSIDHEFVGQADIDARRLNLEPFVFQRPDLQIASSQARTNVGVR